MENEPKSFPIFIDKDKQAGNDWRKYMAANNEGPWIV